LNFKGFLAWLQPSEIVPTRRFSGKLALFALALTVATSLIHVWMNSLGLLISLKVNAIHLGTMMAITFLFTPATSRSPKDRPSALDWALIVLSLGTMAYVLVEYDRILEVHLRVNRLDLAVGVLIMAVLVEASRRAVGLPLTLLSLFFLAYAKFGPYFPGMFAHRGFSWERLIVRMIYTDEGIYGVNLSVSATYVFMFILFGCVLASTRTSDFFNDLSLALAGRFRGGPAKVAVIASSIMGTISGSAQANVATTGAITIPLMKRVGYEPHFAGAVEAAASTGGILMPPIMGAAAFIMATFLGVPYGRIMLAGFTPAVLYYAAVFVMVDLKAKQLGLRGLPPSEIPPLSRVLWERGHMLVPLVALIYFLIAGYTPLYAAFLGLIAVLVLSLLRSTTRIGLRELIGALDEGARSSASVGVSCAIVGFIVGAVGMTGVGQLIAHNIVDLAGGRLWLTCVLCMIASLVLGMGLPATPCYIITATIAAPAMQRLGVSPIAAHFFAFYYGTMSAVVPPVALTSYTAAGLAGASPFKVATTALGLATPGLLLPYVMVYSPVVLLEGFELWHYLFVFLSAAVGVVAISYAVVGVAFTRLGMLWRIPFFASGAMMVSPHKLSTAAGLALFSALLVLDFLRAKAKGRG